MQDLNDIDIDRRDRLININISPQEIEHESVGTTFWNKGSSDKTHVKFDTFLSKKYSIAFDLDNTLIYSTPLQTKNTSFVIYQQKNLDARSRSSSMISGGMPRDLIQMTPKLDSKISSVPNSTRSSIPKGSFRKFYVQIRPDLFEFIRLISKSYNIFFFTASEREYAKEVVSKIFEDAFSKNSRNVDEEDLRNFENYMSNLDQIIFSREHCSFMNGYELKDLRLLNKPLSDVILVDDIQGSGLLQPMNSLIIPAFYGDTDDKFLINELLPLLNKCSETQELIMNIRKFAETLSPHLMLY